MRKIRWYISPFLIIMIAALIASGYFYDCVIYFTTIVLHELAHAEVSVRLGYTLDKFVLMPYGAALKGDFEGVRPKDEILIALAGPLFNAVLAVICTALWWLIPATYAFTDRLVAANLFTAIFNLLPVFPLDGGRIALAALSIKSPRQKAYKRLKIFGYICSPVFALFFIAMIVYNKTVNISFALISVFIFVSTIVPDKNSTYRRLYSMAYLSERLKKGLKVCEIMVPNNVTLIQMDKMLNSNYYTSFIVVDENFKRVGKVSETQLEELLKSHTPLCKIGDIIP
ncbi:MAG: hypothetical protein J1F36_04720 [Clostridiales bacterium]|nr:hypothetical protein [Clostridiales bacterium]